MKNNRTLIFMIVMINAGGYNEEPVDQDEILSNLNHLNDLRSKTRRTLIVMIMMINAGGVG